MAPVSNKYLSAVWPSRWKGMKRPDAISFFDALEEPVRKLLTMLVTEGSIVIDRLKMPKPERGQCCR